MERASRSERHASQALKEIENLPGRRWKQDVNTGTRSHKAVWAKGVGMSHTNLCAVARKMQ